MAVLGQNIAAMPEELAAFDNGSEAAARSNKDPALLELDRYSQAEIQDFAVGTFQLLAQKNSLHPREWLSLSTPRTRRIYRGYGFRRSSLHF